MKRRNFVAGLAFAPLAASLARPAQAQADHLYWKPGRDGHDVLLTSPGTAWKNAFHGVRPAYDSTVPMKVPAGLQGGVLYRNGPALMKLGDTAYRHWLDGDGMLHAFRFEAGQLRHSARLIATNKLRAEQAAGRRLAPGFGTRMPGTAATGPDDMNAANISPLRLGGEVLALGEGGPPYALDPVTLATTGKKVWAPETAALPFSAHPKVDGRGTVWSFGYLPGASALALYELGPQGALARLSFLPVPAPAVADMVHDFAVTEKYLVFVLMPYRYRPGGDAADSFISHYAWQARQPGHVLVVDKATFGVVCLAECDPIGLFHLGNAWEVGNSVRFGVVRYTDFPEAMRRMGTLFDGTMTAWPETRWTEVEVDLSSRTVRTESFDDRTVEFPRHDPRRIGRESRYTYLMGSSRAVSEPPLFGMDTLRRVDRKTASAQQYHYGRQYVAEEHLFTPAPGASAEDAGWVIGTALDCKRRLTVVSVFDAARIDAGPVAQATLPYGLPLGLHGQFYPA